MRWLPYYVLVTMCMVPSGICAISNYIIFSHVRSSTHRVSNGGQGTNISDRDLHLLRHMVIIFSVFFVGSVPLSIATILASYISIGPLTHPCLWIWYRLSLLFTIGDLFLYNHELRRYLIGLCPRCRKNKNPLPIATVPQSPFKPE